MYKFKVGDKVKVIKGTYNGKSLNGQIGVVIQAGEPHELRWCQVKFPNGNVAPFNEDGYGDIVEIINNSHKPKFKLGDQVKIIGKGITASASCNTGYAGVISKIEGMRYQYYYYIGNTGIHEWEEGLELVKEYQELAQDLGLTRKSYLDINITNEPSSSSIKKVGETMSKIANFVKNSLLSADEKLLRKYNLKDECGEYTHEAQELVIAKLIKDNEAYLIQVATDLQAEEKASK